MISDKLEGVSPSLTLGIAAKAKKMRKEGAHVINLSAGEPDFPTPENVKKAAIKALDDNFTYYTPTSGIPELKEAIVEKLRSLNNVAYEPEQISISCGGKHSLFNITQAILNPGDEVLLPVPYWVSYPEQIKLADAKPVFVPTDNHYKIRAELLEDKITERTKLIILNSPSNPAGTICDESELKKISQIVLDNNLFIISDEVYEAFVYDNNKHVSIASLNQEIYAKTIISNAFSKTYSMTGWRVGYTAGPSELINAINRFQGHVTSNPNSIAQKAALEALLGSQDCVTKMVEAFDKRRKYMVERLNEIAGLESTLPEGAFYAFPKLKNLDMPSMEFAERLLDEAKVALVPGIAFGLDENLRLSYAVSQKDIEEGLNRIEDFCGKLE
jgi:aspartate aminotransferase